MSEITNGIPWWGRELARRLEKIEDLKPDVLAEKIAALGDDVQSLKRAFYTFAVSAVGAAVVFAFSVFALLGRH